MHGINIFANWTSFSQCLRNRENDLSLGGNDNRGAERNGLGVKSEDKRSYSSLVFWWATAPGLRSGQANGADWEGGEHLWPWQPRPHDRQVQCDTGSVSHCCSVRHTVAHRATWQTSESLAGVAVPDLAWDANRASPASEVSDGIKKVPIRWPKPKGESWKTLNKIPCVSSPNQLKE